MTNLVTFEQAKILKELGFDVECVYWYNENGIKECPIEQGYMEYYYEVDSFLNDWNAKKIDRDLYGSYPPKVSYSVPSTSDALDWIREKKEIVCYVDVIYHLIEKKAMYLGKILSESGIIIQKKTSDFDTHPLAESALLTEILIHLTK